MKLFKIDKIIIDRSIELLMIMSVQTFCTDMLQIKSSYIANVILISFIKFAIN